MKSNSERNGLFSLQWGTNISIGDEQRANYAPLTIVILYISLAGVNRTVML